MIVANTGWKIQFEENCGETERPRTEELRVLRELKARTAVVHGVSGEAA